MEIIWNLSPFLVGFISCFAIEFLRIIKGSANDYKEKAFFVQILIFLVFISLGGFFVMLLNPSGIINGIILGAAWDQFLVAQIGRRVGNSSI